MRTVLQAVLDELNNKNIIHLALLGEFDFLSGVQNLWAGPEGHVIEFDGKTWTALGDIGQVDKISEAQGLADSRTELSLRINSETVDIVEVEDSRGRAAIITLLVLDDRGTPIGPIVFRMTMGAVSIDAAAQKSEDGGTIVQERLVLELLSETAQLNQSHFVRMTYEAGLRIDPTDHGLEFVSDPEIGNVGLSTQRPGHRPLPPGGPGRGQRR